MLQPQPGSARARARKPGPGALSGAARGLTWLPCSPLAPGSPGKPGSPASPCGKSTAQSSVGSQEGGCPRPLQQQGDVETKQRREGHPRRCSGAAPGAGPLCSPSPGSPYFPSRCLTPHPSGSATMSPPGHLSDIP